MDLLDDANTLAQHIVAVVICLLFACYANGSTLYLFSSQHLA